MAEPARVIPFPTPDGGAAPAPTEPLPPRRTRRERRATPPAPPPTPAPAAPATASTTAPPAPTTPEPPREAPAPKGGGRGTPPSSRRPSRLRQALERPFVAVPVGPPRFTDALVVAGASSGTALWIATRDHASGADVGWAIFALLFGSVVGVEGSRDSELTYAGWGIAATAASYLTLRLLGSAQQPLL